MSSGMASEYIAAIDSGALPVASSIWTLTSPDMTVWGPSITTDGVMSLTSGATAGDSAVFVGIDGTKWVPTISNGGIITLTPTGTLSASDLMASLVDAALVTWFVMVDDDMLAHLTTDTLLPSLLRYPSLIVTFQPNVGTDIFRLYSARMHLTEKLRNA